MTDLSDSSRNNDERTPLLLHSNSQASFVDDVEHATNSNGNGNHHGLRGDSLKQLSNEVEDTIAGQMRVELRHIWNLAGPIILTFLMQIGASIIDNAFVGHWLTSTDLAAVGLASAFVNITGFSVGFGLTSALDTLGSQGATSRNPKIVGLSTQRGAMILLVAALPCAGAFAASRHMFMAAEIDPIVAERASRFTLISIAFLPGIFLYTLLEKYLQTQDIVMPAFWIAVFSLATSVPVHYAAYSIHASLNTAAIIEVLQCSIMAAMLLGYILYSKVYVRTWPKWSIHSLTNWGTFMALGVAAWFMVGIEWWSFEISQFVAGKISTTTLDSQVVAVQIGVFLFMVPYGIGEATSVHVGNLLGMGEARRASIAAKTAMLASIFSGALIATIVYFARHKIVLLYTSDDKVLSSLDKIMAVVSFFHVSDSIQGVAGGVIRGCGHQTMGVVINFIGYWMIGGPLVYLFAFHLGHEGVGIWYGLTCASCFQAIFYVARIFAIDWKRETALAAVRTSEGTGDKADDGPGSAAIQADDQGRELGLAANSEQWSNTGSGSSGSQTRSPRMSVLQIISIALCISALIAGFLIRDRTSVPSVCFPLPDVANAKTTCGSWTSTYVNRVCQVECEAGFKLVGGQFTCMADGSFVGAASCVPA
eukprot:m.60432 g.60432  ORF g.60432 m.60432 type:complete len:649 (+) comp13662_c0_seq1:106-2052(+)